MKEKTSIIRQILNGILYVVIIFIFIFYIAVSLVSLSSLLERVDVIKIPDCLNPPCVELQKDRPLSLFSRPLSHWPTPKPQYVPPPKSTKQKVFEATVVIIVFLDGVAGAYYSLIFLMRRKYKALIGVGISAGILLLLFPIIALVYGLL